MSQTVLPGQASPGAAFAENRQRLASHYLVPFRGKWVAWHPDGTHLFAVADSPDELLTRLTVLGICLQQVVIEHLDGLPATVSAGIDTALFHANQRRLSVDDLAAYQGQQVAWQADGSRIVAAGDSHEDLQNRLRELGIDPLTVVYDFIDAPNVTRS